jgi:hypothetical protein
MNLAINYRALERHEDAAKAAQRAVSIDPISMHVRQEGSTFQQHGDQLRTRVGAELDE